MGGGVQSLQEKMNLADVNKSQVDSSSDEDELPPSQQDQNKLQVPASRNDNRNSSMSNHSGEELLHTRESSLSLPNVHNARNGGSALTIENVEELENSQRSKNALPEDQEIIEEEEE